MKVSKLNGAKRVVVAIRPEKIKLGRSEMDNVYSGIIEEISYLGGFIALKTRINGVCIKCLTSSELKFEENQMVELGWRADDVIVFEA
ncbi:MAG: TOBE domain-containing protein [Archaeoglobaceae archaeon]|nr:TOBE domain-containing protein [Archaeoglobaceae archaeon]